MSVDLVYTADEVFPGFGLTDTVMVEVSTLLSGKIKTDFGFDNCE
jgi:hypothetical protein